MHRKIKTFATVALLEGISYLLLLGIAMPLKYLFHFPQAVQVVGWAHGILFMMYCIMLLICWIAYRWTFKRVVWYFVAALLPIVPFFVERKLKREYTIA